MRPKRIIADATFATLVWSATAIAFFSGGYFDGPRLVLGLVAWAMVLVLAIVTDSPVPTSLPGRVALAGLALLTALTAASIAWAPLSSAAVDDTQRLLAYLGVFVAGVALLRSRRYARVVEPALAAGAFAVIAYALSERLLPGLVELQRSTSAAGRLDQPLTYWNAVGSLAAMGFVLSTRVAGDPNRERRLRAVAGFAAPWLALGLFLSLSRGAIAACLVGLAVLALLAPSSAQVRAIVRNVALSAPAILVCLPLAAVRSLDAAAASPELEGLTVLVVLLAASAAGARLAGRPLPSAVAESSAHTRTTRVAARAMLAACVVGAILGTVVFTEQRDAVSGPRAGAGPERLRSVESNRRAYWDVAAGVFASHPGLGVGSGGFRVEWVRERRFKEPAEDAHSIYVETAAELGLAGLAGLALLLAGVAGCARRALSSERGRAVGGIAALAVWALHAGLDWGWEMPAVTVPAVVLAAALVAAAEATGEGVPARAD